ncbi:R3H-associated N-terminal domain-domain-containing protein [Clohesyomyces aquaticus]|uniref:R3H-associated N-terminal domain-domain-containing protein n=1 Tax=Clohesyomyces aquaticus TaxID=1231657 RepID=A0A1Y1ZGY1_9PLEO|nr:R3H-associated N-terminal domain-domain-containing protein [Clohesyomyces aquaticus]
MAIHPLPEAPHSAQAASTTQPIDIEVWTEQAAVALSSVTISSPGDAQGATVSLQIPLDEHPAARPSPAAMAEKEGGNAAYYRRKELLRRDSLKKREALLKGKEGSRRRQRWENDHLLNNPHAEPPTARDWEIHPTHPIHHVPYYLAPLWEAGLKARSMERKTASAKTSSAARPVSSKPTDPGVVPRELRDKLKRSRGAKGLLMDLESEVRSFVLRWEEKERNAKEEGLPADPDSSDDEIVFVGRNGQMNDLRSPHPSDEVKREMMLFETPEGDQGGSFGRWLVHHIGTYYGLKTWSVTVDGNPARREAYIGLKDAKMKSGRRRSSIICNPMPRPLWVVV